MGRYICIEGVKGSGKTTLINGLKTMLDQQGVDWVSVSPTKPAAGFSVLEVVAAKLPRLRTIDRFNEALYAYRSNTTAHLTDWNKSLLIGDRSVITSYVTRWHKYADPHRCINRVNRIEWAIRPPDHVIYLQVDIKTAVTRTQNRKGRAYGKHDETERRIAQNIEAYNALMTGTWPVERIANTRWHVVDGNRAPQFVVDECLELIAHLAPECLHTQVRTNTGLCI